MHLRRRIVGLIAGVAVVALGGVTVAPAASAHAPTGTKSLASVLTSGKVGFDRNSRDYDILTAAVLAVLKAKPGSPVGVLADGTVALTAFLPTDRAFERLVKQLTGSWPTSESAAFAAVAGLGIDTVETVLLYHVVPGATIDKRTAFKSDGAALTTAQGGTVTVDVHRCWFFRHITLIDNDPEVRDPAIVQFDINKGNLQIAHGISRVLLPVVI